MFQKGHHYKNKRFRFKVLGITGDKMFVLIENGEKVMLSLEFQTRIQRNISSQNEKASTHLIIQKRSNSPQWKQHISEWQIKSLANPNKK